MGRKLSFVIQYSKKGEHEDDYSSNDEKIFNMRTASFKFTFNFCPPKTKPQNNNTKDYIKHLSNHNFVKRQLIRVPSGIGATKIAGVKGCF